MSLRTLACAWLLALLLWGAGAALSLPRGAEGRGGGGPGVAPAFPEHVVLVLLGGGVRAQDMADAKRMPTLAALGAEGLWAGKVDAGAPDGWNGVARILTGRSDPVDGARKQSPVWPTIAEYVRSGLALGPEHVWHVGTEGGAALRLSCSTHPEYGTRLGPTTAYGMGPFAEPLRGFLDAFGRPLPLEHDAWGPLRRLRLASREAASAWLPPGLDAGLPEAERVERALLEELDRKALLNRGPNPRDEQALRAAMTVLAVHAPRLLVVQLEEAEQAESSLAAYEAVLAATDAGLARLRGALAAHPRMGGRTTLLVVADRGRNAAADAAGRLGADDASRQRGWVGLCMAGPGLLRRPRLEGPMAVEDICPIVGHLLGVSTPYAAGRVWPAAFEPR